MTHLRSEEGQVWRKEGKAVRIIKEDDATPRQKAWRIVLDYSWRDYETSEIVYVENECFSEVVEKKLKASFEGVPQFGLKGGDVLNRFSLTPPKVSNKIRGYFQK